MNSYKTPILVTTLFLITSFNGFAQKRHGDEPSSYSGLTTTQTDSLSEAVSTLRGQLESLSESLLETKTTVDALKKIKLSGYIQTQFQTAESAGQASFAGGNFGPNVKQRFAVRRGRMKVAYDNDLTQYVLQIDVTQWGVGIKDAYAQFTEPWLRTLTLTGGIFNRPFGFEIEYSSGNRESPERSRIYQTLFPGERDLGVKLTVAPQLSSLDFLRLDAGFFNGTGPTANDFDTRKDFIGRLSGQFPLRQLDLQIDLGASAYVGGVRQSTKYVYNTGLLPSGAKGFLVDSSSTNLGASARRSYLGIDAQLYFDIPLLGGMTLRGEYLTGSQPGTATSSSSPTSQPTADAYIRGFHGWYVYYVQNVGLDHQFVVKYDVYDPNTRASGTNIGASGANFTAADVRFATLGFGWLYHWDANVKLSAYYEVVRNEIVHPLAAGTLSPFVRDLKDNVLTLRIQYRY